MDDLTRDTARSYFWNQAAVILDAVGALALSVIVARMAGANAFGVFAWVGGAVGLATLAGALGLKESAAVIVQRFHSNVPALRSLFARYFTLRMASAVVAAAALATGLSRAGGWSLALAAGAYAAAILVSALLSAFDIALFRTRAVAVGRIVSLGVSLPLGVLGASLGSMPLVFAALASGAVAASVVYFWPLRHLAFGPATKTRIQGLFELPMILWFVGFFNYLIGAFAAPTLIKVAGLGDGTIAAFTAGVYVALWAQRMVVGGFANVILAAFSRAAMEGQGALARIHSLYVRATAALTMPLIAGSVVFAPVLARIWLKGDTADAVAVARIVGVLLLASRIAGGGAHSTALYSSGLHRQGLAIRAVFAALALVLIPIAAMQWGVKAAAAACGGVGLAVVAVEWLILRSHREVGMPWASLVRLSAACVAAAAAAACVLGESTVSVVLAAVIYIAVAFLALRVARPLEAGEAASIAREGPLRALLAFFERPSRPPR